MTVQTVRQKVLLMVAAAIVAFALMGASASFAPVYADGGSCASVACGD